MQFSSGGKQVVHAHTLNLATPIYLLTTKPPHFFSLFTSDRDNQMSMIYEMLAPHVEDLPPAGTPMVKFSKNSTGTCQACNPFDDEDDDGVSIRVAHV